MKENRDMLGSMLFLCLILSLLFEVTSSIQDVGVRPAVGAIQKDISVVENSTSISIPEWKKKLPYPLNNRTKTLQRLIIPGPRNRSVEILLLGTAHVSKDSSRDVELLLETIKPDVIFLELCDQRVPMLVAPPQKKEKSCTPKKKDKKWWKPRKRPKENGKPKNIYSVAATMLTDMQQDYADSLGVELGGEFRTAYNFWEKHRTDDSDIHMILGDRPLYLTLTRAWESLHLWGKLKLLVGLFVSTLQKPNAEELKEWMESILNDDTGDLLTKSIDELKTHFPTLEEVIIRERDAYMACKLYQTCRQLLMVNSQQQVQRVCAIVGAGHVQGMCHWLTVGNGKAPEEVLEDLIKIKKAVPKEDALVLTHDVMAVNHEMLQEIAKEMQALPEQNLIEEI